MKWTKVLVVAGLILLVSGCTDYFMICSLNPFYLDKNITLVPEIEGNWAVIPIKPKSSADPKKADEQDKSEVWKQMDLNSSWKIERRIAQETVRTAKGKDSVTYRPNDFYTVKLMKAKTDSAFYQFKMVLFRVNKVLYADFMPIEYTGLGRSRFAMESYFRIHTLARVLMHDGHPEISWLGAAYMQEMIEKRRVRVSYRWVSDAGRLLLTGSSEELTGMIDRYAGEPRFIDWENQPAMLQLKRLNQ